MPMSTYLSKGVLLYPCRSPICIFWKSLRMHGSAHFVDCRERELGVSQLSSTQPNRALTPMRDTSITR